MKPSFALPFVLIAGLAQAQDTGFAPESVEPVTPVFTKPFIPSEEEVVDEEEPEDEDAEEEESTADEESPGDEEDSGEPDLDGGPVPDDEDPDVWFPGGPWKPDVIYTMTGGGDPADDEELHPWDPLPGDIDPVIYQTGLPPVPKVSLKEKRADLHADIVDGCVVTYGAWDRDGNGALDLTEFSAHWPGPARSHKLAFKRIDKNRNGLITADEFSTKKSTPLVVPRSMGLLEAAAYRANFDALDFDGNGFLTFGEFTAVLRPSGPGILEAIFAEADRNGDGKISFAEYTHRPVNPAGVE